MEVIKKEVLKSLPSSPGVYLLKDKKGRLLYIGKGKKSKNPAPFLSYPERSKGPETSDSLFNARDM